MNEAFSIVSGVGLLLLLATQCVAGPTKIHNDTNSTDGLIDSDNLPYFTQLDDNFELRWNFNSTHIVFQTKVKTKGYIGFGISDHGSMFPSDIIAAWVEDDGRVHFQDRHATGHFAPPVDASQDWHLISGSEDDQFTSITMIRQLDTCDSDDDMVITDGTTRLVYSYSSVDPDSDDAIFYHGMNRGTKSVLLLDPPANENNAANLPDDVITIDMLNKNYSVPATDTMYHCQAFKLPPLKGKHHVIRYEPIIQKGNEKLVHHITLYYCEAGITDDMADISYDCYHNHVPKHFFKCSRILLGWAIGGTAFDFPDHVGYPLGGADDPAYFRLETHFDNPEMRDDFVDNSGLRLILTKELRTHDAGLLEAGVKVNKYQIIPPFAESFLSRGVCHESCLEDALGDDEIYIFADFLHSHLLGKKIATRLVRNGTELAPILADNNYDFNYQENRLLKEERVVKKGDALIVDCYYDSSKRPNITYGGLSTSEEMCLSLLLYYPRKPIAACLSKPVYNIQHQYQIIKIAKEMDFKNETARDEFAAMISQTDVMRLCVTKDHYQYGKASMPVINQPFVPENRCNKN